MLCCRLVAGRGAGRLIAGPPDAVVGRPKWSRLSDQFWAGLGRKYHTPLFEIRDSKLQAGS
jgi:hypothetical protein